MVIEWSNEDSAFLVRLPEFHDVRTHGDTYREAVRHGEEVLELLIDSYREEGRALPEPLLAVVAASR